MASKVIVYVPPRTRLSEKSRHLCGTILIRQTLNVSETGENENPFITTAGPNHAAGFTMPVVFLISHNKCNLTSDHELRKQYT